jgi:hypothetical protein
VTPARCAKCHEAIARGAAGDVTCQGRPYHWYCAPPEIDAVTVAGLAVLAQETAAVNAWQGRRLARALAVLRWIAANAGEPAIIAAARAGLAEHTSTQA